MKLFYFTLIERKLEKKADEKSDDVLDAIFDKEEEGKDGSQEEGSNQDQDASSETGGFDLGGMMDILQNQGNAAYETQYVFPISATMEVSNAGSNSTHMIQSYGKDALMARVENTPGDVITDFKNETMLMLNIEDGTAQVMSMGFMNMMGMGSDDAESENEQPDINKTGNTKTMHGYTCHEYIIKSDGVDMIAWFAPDVNFNYQDYLKGFAKMFAGAKNNPGTLLNQGFGYVMEMEATNENGELTTMKVITLSEEVKTITMSDFKIQQL